MNMARVGIRPCSKSSVEPFLDVGDVHKAQKSDVELVRLGVNTAKYHHALENVFNQVVRFVAVPVQDALVFAVDPAKDDDLHAAPERFGQSRPSRRPCPPEGLWPANPMSSPGPGWESCRCPGSAQSAPGFQSIGRVA